MRKRIHAFNYFVRLFFRYALYVREVLFGLLVLLTIGGVTFSYLEDIPLDHAIYFAFITGLSIGYGDITPKTGLGCVVAVGIGMVGMVFIGITVAAATRALSELAKHEHGTPVMRSRGHRSVIAFSLISYVQNASIANQLS